ncbi:unnamed protein product [Lymnaea stagnalis]|uniref:AIG1-type G domain-containing protein n=1 Tax=Lymnaea stagnalis TaxID=6523 RepID=A0AAV2IH15_LYMST
MVHEYNLLLVGRIGNGKSSTGNTILGRPEFSPRAACRVSRDDIMKYGTVRDDERNRLIHVVDGTGIGDAGKDAQLDKESLIARMNENLWSHVTELTAVVLVLKFGVTFTKQERVQVQAIKGLLGDDVMRRWGVIVMTYGDNFEKDNATSFETWCRDRRGEFKRLLEECDHRCVLFNNRNRTQDQVDRLFVLVDKIQCPYKKRYFDIRVEDDGLGGEEHHILNDKGLTNKGVTKNGTHPGLNGRRCPTQIGYWLQNLCCIKPRNNTRVGDERSVHITEYVELSLVYNQQKSGR